MYPNCNQGYTGFMPNTAYAFNPVPTVPTSIPLQQPQMNNVLIGRTVNSSDDIKPNEVPMDGNFAIFPTNDGQFVYVKRWKTDGTIETSVFKKSEENLPIIKEDPIAELKAYLEERFDKLEHTTKKEAK